LLRRRIAALAMESISCKHRGDGRRHFALARDATPHFRFASGLPQAGGHERKIGARPSQSV
jgi:hypothetical protein